MKVGIITFSRADNYGAMLQCYALFQFLKAKGYNVEIIDYRDRYIEHNYRGIPNLRKNMYIWLKECIKRLVDIKDRNKRQKTFDEMRKLLIFSSSFSKKKLRKGLGQYSAIIVGSDQVWNPKITKKLNDVYFLNFKGDFRKIAYAVSLGSVNQKEYKENYFITQIKSFNNLSFREQDAVDFINNNYSLTSKCCVDPVFLLSVNQWQKFSESSKIKMDKPYILLYFLEKNPDIIKIAEDLSQKYDVQILCCNKNKGENNNIIWINNIGPIEFVRLVKDAEIVVTSSFHATAFSVIFQKKLFMMLHSKTGSRVKTLATHAGIQEWIFDSYQDYIDKRKIDEFVEYDLENLKEQIQNSKEYLMNVLNYDVEKE